MEAVLRRNIQILYILNLFAGIVFWYPIEKLFMQSIGINSFGVSINAVVFIAMLALFDVPAGVLADKWKRKYVLFLAFLSLLLSSVVGGLSHNLPEYICMTILLTGFVVLTQGTFQALMYDSLRGIGEEKHYDRHQGRSYALFLAGLGGSALLGGYLAQWTSYRWTYYATALVMVAALVITTQLIEPRSHKHLSDRKLKEHIVYSFRHIMASRLLLELAMLITAASVLRNAQNEYGGLYFIALGLTAIPIGYASAAKWLLSSIGQIIAPKLGRKALRLTPVFLITFSLFSLIHTRWSLIFFFLAGLLFAVISNQAEAVVQDNTPSEVRATMLSIFTFASNVILIPLGLLFGWIAQTSNVFNAYLAISTVGLLYLASWLLSGRRVLAGTYS